MDDDDLKFGATKTGGMIKTLKNSKSALIDDKRMSMYTLITLKMGSKISKEGEEFFQSKSGSQSDSENNSED